MLKVAGPDNLLAYSGKEVDAVYLGSQAEAGSEAAAVYKERGMVSGR